MSIDNNMSLDDIYYLTMDISNSIYTLRKNGDLGQLSEEEFKILYGLAYRLYNKISSTIAKESRKK